MKLLISAYACAPDRGSEHGCGWNWTSEVARLGYEATVLVSPAHRTAILAATQQDPVLQLIRWVFPEVALWPLQQGKEPGWERTYNLLWQREALRVARALHREQPFDLVHHLTWAGVRAPTFLGALGAPLIIGPVGGGETSPGKLRDRFSLRGRVLEGVRDLSNATIELNPIVRQGLRDAMVIFTRTADTRNLLSPSLRAKTYVQMELGVRPAQIGAPRPLRKTPRKLLYAGRLLYWKGVHIAIEAMSEARWGYAGCAPDDRREWPGRDPIEVRNCPAESSARTSRSYLGCHESSFYVSTTLMTFSSFPACTTVQGGWFSNPFARDCRSPASISAGRRISSRRSPGS